MDTPNDEAGRMTEEIMFEMPRGWKSKHSTEKYNACYSAVYELLKEILDNETAT